MILIIALLLLGWLIVWPTAKIGYSRPFATPLEAGHQFTEQELLEFIKIWDKAHKSPVKKYVNDPIARINGTTPWLFKQWLNLHDWNDQRFYYYEERLHDIVKCVVIKNNYDDNIKMKQNGNNALDIIIKQQEQQLSVCSFEQNELDLINNNLAEIKKTIPQIM